MTFTAVFELKENEEVLPNQYRSTCIEKGLEHHFSLSLWEPQYRFLSNLVYDDVADHFVYLFRDREMSDWTFYYNMMILHMYFKDSHDAVYARLLV